MRINEVMKETGLTKKAIYYYENEGLIRPRKDQDNNYRDYTEDDVRRLIIINILRKLDVSVKVIGSIINNSASMKEVLREQLALTNRKINQLFQNKKIMNDLIVKEIEESDFSFDTLKDFNLSLGKSMLGTGYVGKDLEQAFPGTLGKTFSLFYGNLSNVPLDTDENLEAWNGLITKVDESKEIDFPEDIRSTVDELYEECEGLKGALLAKESLVGYYAAPENQQRIEGFYQLQNFILQYHDIYQEIDRYINSIKKESDINQETNL